MGRGEEQMTGDDFTYEDELFLAEFDRTESLPLLDPDRALFERLNGISRKREQWRELGYGE